MISHRHDPSRPATPGPRTLRSRPTHKIPDRPGRHPDPQSREFDWASYEELVKDIYEALGRAQGVTIECWGRRCTVRVAGGVPRQVDVLTRHVVGERMYRTAISCKWWNERVDVAHVSDFALTVQDAQLSKGVIVSKMGFTVPATNLARAKGIELVELRNPLDADWEGSITHVQGEIVYCPPPEFRYSLSMTKPGIDPRRRECQGRPIHFATSPDQLVITEPGMQSTTLLQQARSAFPDVVDGAEFAIDFQRGTTLTMLGDEDHPAYGAFLQRVTVQIRVPVPLRTEIEVNAADHIYMIMESLLDGRRFNITSDGEIIELS
ncbi:MAG: restriction endonuclease [Acidimicrobiaceae bacterium]|nr:restriction endonuclease [Acidimicrobiaceae bacterium]